MFDSLMFWKTKPVPIQEVPVVKEIHEENETQFHNLLSTMANERLIKERGFVNSNKINKAIKKAINHIACKSGTILIGHSDIDIDEEFMPIFFEVFSKLCSSYKIEVSFPGSFIHVDGPSFNRAISLILKKERADIIDEKSRQLLSTGIYR